MRSEFTRSNEVPFYWKGETVAETDYHDDKGECNLCGHCHEVGSVDDDWEEEHYKATDKSVDR